jgi:hypothetical protein
MPNCPLCNSYIEIGMGHACSKAMPADDFICTECARKEVELKHLREAHNKLVVILDRYKNAVDAMDRYHTCHFHPHVTCAACEVQRRVR